MTDIGNTYLLVVSKIIEFTPKCKSNVWYTNGKSIKPNVFNTIIKVDNYIKFNVLNSKLLPLLFGNAEANKNQKVAT